jgi:hypothetical protein
MTFDDMTGIVVAVLLGAYLVYGLVRRGNV